MPQCILCRTPLRACSSADVLPSTLPADLPQSVARAGSCNSYVGAPASTCDLGRGSLVLSNTAGVSKWVLEPAGGAPNRFYIRLPVRWGGWGGRVWAAGESLRGEAPAA